MKKELEKIANKHNMELEEVVRVAKKLLDKIEEVTAEFEVGDEVITPSGIGEIKQVLRKDLWESGIQTYIVKVTQQTKLLGLGATKKKLEIYEKSELKKLRRGGIVEGITKE